LVQQDPGIDSHFAIITQFGSLYLNLAAQLNDFAEERDEKRHTTRNNRS